MKLRSTFTLLLITFYWSLHVGSFKVSLALSLIKAGLVGFVFMELHRSHLAWRALFLLLTVVPIGIVLVL